VAPTKTVPRPGRALAALVALIVIMLLGVLGADLSSPGHWHENFKVRLGLDLSGGTQVIMTATTPTGGIPSTAEMNEAISIILARVNGTGNSGALVQTQGRQDLTVSVPGKPSQQTDSLVSTTAYLNFRQTLLYQPYSGPAAPSALATPSASAKADPVTNASSTPSTSPSASPSPSATSPASSSSTALGDPSLVNKATLALFNKLTCRPGDSVKWKQQVGYATANAYDNPAVQIVSCDPATGGKYALDQAAVQGNQISGATATESTNNEWVVNLTFKSAGASAFGKLTSDQYNKYYAAGGDNPATSDYWLDTTAIVLDGNIASDDEIQGAILGGNAQITGNFTQAAATQLQNVLKYGSLPLKLKLQSVDAVSAQLGRAQLDGGLIAGAIGLGLVVIYSFMYYRGLGLVSVSSLIIAGGLVMLSVVLLSKYQSFTLELSGIVGLIVAIGITADSFVVFFERLRDEVREGKQLRPAVEAGWKRARRTILVSDTVSFIAALLLYYFSIGEVKGFAYTLGLTTLIDIVVVFMFTKPMVTLLARTKFFGNGAPLSGLDPARLGARGPWRSSVPRAAARRRPTSVPRGPAPPSNPASRNTAPRNTEEA
jgi:preprotein translocase subunit SecD